MLRYFNEIRTYFRTVRANLAHLTVITIRKVTKITNDD